MRVSYGKTFENADGEWERVEFELTGDDLLPSEKKANQTGHPMLLALRAEQNLWFFLRSNGYVTDDEANEKFASITKQREQLVGVPALKKVTRETEH